jgi:tetratricopeptide (TPR) repeat protein
MKIQRSDFNLDRNKQIYNEYLTSDASFNMLAKKYDLSPQRIAAIISDIKTKGLGKSLKTTDTKEQRNAYKDQAVEVREKGNIELSLNMFDEILEWDKFHENHRGFTDVCGHKKIALTLLADKFTKPADKKHYLTLAVKSIEEGLEVAKKIVDIAPGNTSIQQIHMASLLLQLSEFQDPQEKVDGLKQARRLLDASFAHLAGSRAHQAWPLSILALVHAHLGAFDKALGCLQKAQQNLEEGYEEELKYGDQSKMKLRVWNTGVMLGFAQVYKLMHKNILAEVYAGAVLYTPDPEKILVARKKQAEKLLKELE